MAVAVLDARGVLKAFGAEEGTALRRADIAIGKAHGALAMGVGSRTLGKRAEERLDTHAWLDAAGVEVTGYPVAPHFAEIACFV